MARPSGSPPNNNHTMPKIRIIKSVGIKGIITPVGSILEVSDVVARQLKSAGQGVDATRGAEQTAANFSPSPSADASKKKARR